MGVASRKPKVKPVETSRRSHAERRATAERRILRAAIAQIARGGLAALNLNAVGEAAGYSRGLPAHYFKRKDRLVAACAQRIATGFDKGWSRETNPEFGGLENVLRIADYYLASVEKDPVSVRAMLVMVAEAPQQPELLAEVANLNRRSAATFTDLVRRAQEMGEVSQALDAEAMGMLIRGMLRGVAAQWLVDPERFSMAHLRDNLRQVLKSGLSAR